MADHILTLKLLKETYGVCRLNPDEILPDWVRKSDFFSITATSEELSVVCVQNCIPEHIRCEKDWRILQVEGTLDFSLIGILSSISTILAHNKISIFVISTFDTDYILVKDKDIDAAILALKSESDLYQVVQ